MSTFNGGPKHGETNARWMPSSKEDGLTGGLRESVETIAAALTGVAGAWGHR
ncbi:hypothetical protein GCM10023194_38410 [Planotetraspora phitsanulokensis]|uniref:Uncharacterized protein n=1 Tax=Planotetraspora phitsanulokensis TaxID=575192 RepID=A0A8J3XIR2_9ACTN|nr:hypothetical protein [Planotetraspora phitsanulokensis]GII41196.1 hypothetical protein Pph01_61990 [Planotetraspora phitsanulokensis]